ncbi:MAG: TolC family protein [Leptospiraceae bacterium]|nr:TolC family protein [Leptospiraceae bacterium]MCK6380420.1 TolC family protein [Leptospiraceae bacterium]NUM41184.1 TolC family protein [Leptospiraceae bacterium]
MKFNFLFILFFIPAYGIFSGGNDHDEPHLHCTGSVTLKDIVECVIDHSPEYKSSRLELNVIKGRKIAAGYFFPSNPQVSLMQSYRKQTQNQGEFTGLQSSVNGEVMLSQEIYIGGQRKGRLDVADKEFASQVRRVTVMEREMIYNALVASLMYFSLIEELRLSENLYSLAKDIYEVAKARSEKGLAAPIDTDIAEAELVKMKRFFLLTKRKTELAKGNLTVMMGIPFHASIELLEKPKNPVFQNMSVDRLTEEALKVRAEIQASEADILTQDSKITLLKKETIPNLTISGFLQRDGFNENVIGGRLSLPLKIFRDNSGELLEELSRKQQLINKAEVSRHTIRYEVIKSISGYNSLKEEYESYSEELLQRIDKDLDSIKKALLNGRINVREALMSQQSLIGTKISYIQSKTDFAIASIEVIRASGIPFTDYLNSESKKEIK